MPRPRAVPPAPAPAGFRSQIEWREYGLVVGGVALVTAIGLLLPPTSHASVALIYLLALLLLSLRVGRWPMLLAGLLSASIWEYIFLAPRFEFRINNLQDILLFGLFFVLALVTGQLTSQIRAQARKERVREENERLTRTLLDSVSHEMRTPLAVITAGLENFEASAPTVQAGLADEMRTAARRLNRFVGNLLDQTRLESGTLKPRLEWCDARDLANAAAETVSDALAGRPFTVAVPEEMPSVLADFTLTEHALSNLLLNAAVHTPPGKAINLTAGIAPDGHRAYFSVSDRGPGIPPALQGRLFKKFARGDSARPGGLGLGLSIVHGFVTAQGGEVVLDWNPEGGAVFSIYLPHTPPQPDPHA